jgi:hypothetical protein
MDFTSNTNMFKETQTVPQLSRNLFIPKHSLAARRYAELDIFRREIEQCKAGFYHRPYTSNKRNVLIYKSIFFGFALLFAILSFITIGISFVPFWGFLTFNLISLFKTAIFSLCFLLSASAFSIAFIIKPEREAILHSVRKARAQMARIYARKRIRTGINWHTAIFGPQRHLATALRQLYDETHDRINDRKEEATHLVQRIMTAETLDWPQKEALLNQAIEELHEKLMLLAHTFRHASPS